MVVSTPGEGSEGNKKKGKNRQTNKHKQTFNLGFSRCDWCLLPLCFHWLARHCDVHRWKLRGVPELSRRSNYPPGSCGAPVCGTGSGSRQFAAAAAAALSLHTSSASSWARIYATACHTNLLGYNDDANSPGLHQPHEKAPAWESANITQLFFFFLTVAGCVAQLT